MKKESGSVHIIVTVILVIALLGALGFIFWQNFIKQSAKSDSSKVANEKTCTDTFVNANILKEFTFSTAGNEQKTFIVYKVGEDDNPTPIPRADTYVTTRDLCKANAVKIDALSVSEENEYGLGLAIQQDIIQKITVSSGKNKRYVVVETHGPGDGSYLHIVDEDGSYIGAAPMALDYVSLVENYGQIGFWDFIRWDNDTDFIVGTSTGNGSILYLTIDAATGKAIGNVTVQ